MALKTKPLFSDKWVAGLAPVSESGMTAEVAIYTIGDRVWVPETDTWTEETTTIVLSRARVQPIRSAYREIRAGDTTTVQNVQVSLPVENVVAPLEVNQRVAVLSSPLNPEQEKNQLIVSEVIDSSNPIERTIICTINQEIYPNPGAPNG